MNKKIIIIILSIVLIIGIGITLFLVFSKEKLENAYSKMQINDKLKSYAFDLRIISSNKEKPFLYIVNIKNYMNEVYKVNLVDLKSLKGNIFNINKKPDYIYIKDNIVYRKNSKGIYEKTNDEVLYFNSNIYLSSLNNIEKISKKETVKLSKNKYSLYKVEFNKKYGDTLTKYLEIDDIYNNSSLLTGDIYIDKKGYVYKIIFRVEKIMIMTTYYDFNKVSEIKIPNN